MDNYREAATHLPGPEPLRFKVQGLDCQNEVRALKAAVGPLVGGEDKLAFDTKAGTMDVAPQDRAAPEEIERAVATTGMRASLWRDAPVELSFKVRGLDCQNEVRALKAAVGPIVGGEDRLEFDTKAGKMIVSAPAFLSTDKIRRAVATTGMQAEPWPESDIVAPAAPTGDACCVPVERLHEPLIFNVQGLDCQNEVRALKAAVGPLVGGEDKLTFDTKAGTMTVAAQDHAAPEVIEQAVATTGMRASLRHNDPTEHRFRVRGLDCRNEIRALKAAVGPLVGGDDKLTFDTKAGMMIVSASASLSTDEIRRAVATTGMQAELWSEGDVPSPAPTGDACGSAALTTPVPVQLPGQTVLRIHGMDCGEEVAALKREVGPVVGGEDKLAFDLINGRMSIAGDSDTATLERVTKAVTRTGMQAELWQEGATTEATEADERRRRLQTALTTASGVLAALGFGLHAWLGGGVAAAFMGEAEAPWLSLLAYAASILCAVRYVAPKAWLAARRLRPDMNLLMVVAVLGAVLIGEWFEAATVSFFFALALALEAWSLGRARRAVAALMELAPPTARVRFPDGSEREVPAGEVAVGGRIVVRPGDKLPLDGRVVAGTSDVNQAPITGESAPVAVASGSEVFAGTINGAGALEIETTKAAQDTTLAQIIRMVGSAQSRRAPTEAWVEQFARIYTPTVMALAIAVFLLPPLLLGGDWEMWFYRALVLLVIACPCALVISTPVSIVAALTGAARMGVLVKGGVYLEAPAHLKAVAMDKTGTLTEGRPRVADLVPLGGRSEADLLALAAALEARSEHPLARAILENAKERGVSPVPAEDVQAVPGKGVTGRVNGRAVWLGSRRYMEERGFATPEALQRADVLAAAGRTLVAVGDEGGVWGLIAVADTVRPAARAAVAALHAAGIERVVMLTGDNRATAEAIARETGVDEVRAELLPADKVAAVEDLVSRHGAVAMVGDGVNDAPAMARANLGIAMGAVGTDAAIETADIALMSDDLSKLPWLVRHSRRTLGVIRQNIGFSIAVKLVFMVLTFAGMASLWGAIAADVGASLLVVLNGLRLLRTQDETSGAGQAPGGGLLTAPVRTA